MLISCWKGNIFSLFSHKLCPGCSSLHSPGEVVLLVPMPADGPADSWQLLPDGRAASPTTSFTQQDINEGIVWYRHSGTQVESDSFQFQVLLPFIFPQSSSGGICLWDYLVCHSHCLLTWAFYIYICTRIHKHTHKYAYKYICIFTRRPVKYNYNIYTYLHADLCVCSCTLFVCKWMSTCWCLRVDAHLFCIPGRLSFVSKKAFTVWIATFDL